MIYSNDDADKSIRRKNFILTVYIFPILTTLGICCLIYFGAKSNLISKQEIFYGYLLSLTPGFLLYGINKKKWLKMPDGSFHNVWELNSHTIYNENEPNEFENEYYNSKKDKAISTMFGFIAIGGGLWLGLNSPKTVLIPISTSLMGVFLAYRGIKGLLDKDAKLKIAKNGLWTKKLGFKNWDEINFAEVIIDKTRKQPQTILEIRLKGTKFEEANKPDEILNLTEIQNKDDVEIVINSSIIKYNELNNQNIQKQELENNSVNNEKKEKSNNLTQVYIMLMFIGVMCIGFNLNNYERHYKGEPLVFKHIIIKEKPEYINPRRGTSRYTFKGTNYNCRFWISEGALDEVFENDKIKEEVEKINIGDTILIGIRNLDESKLIDSSFRPRVIELAKNNRNIITAKAVEKNDKKNYNINIYFGIIALSIGAILLTIQMIRKKYK